MTEGDGTQRESYDVGGVRMARPFKVGRLGHLGLYVHDLATVADFYEQRLGFRKSDAISGGGVGPDPRGIFLTYGADHHSLVLIHSSVGEARGQRISRGITVNQMSFQVGTLAEVVDAYRFFKGRNCEIWRVGRDVPGSNYAVYFPDPDDHIVELYYGMEQIGWNRCSKPKEFSQYASREEPVLPRPAEWDEIAAITKEHPILSQGSQSLDPLPPRYDVGGIRLPRPYKVLRTGPVKLFVNDVEASRMFYVDRLGFAVTEEVIFEGERCVFLRNGTEHHSLALLPSRLRERLGLSRHTTMMSFGLQVGSYQQLREGVRFLQSGGVPFVKIPPELSPGVDYSAYILDPEGHCLQLYYYIEQIGWDGRPRPMSLRRRVVDDVWPDTVEPASDTYADRTFQGPLG